MVGAGHGEAVSSLLAALILVFLAELGDKTQLVAVGFGARHRMGPVLGGMALAYVATGTISVVVGGVLGAALPTTAVGVGGGLLFLCFALWTLRPPSSGVDEESLPEPRPRRVVLSVAAAMFLAELGDKTMLATATLAAKGNPVLVWFGATVGIFASGAIGVMVGRTFGRRLPERAIRFGSAAVFAVFGLVLIATSR